MGNCLGCHIFCQPVFDVLCAICICTVSVVSFGNIGW